MNTKKGIASPILNLIFSVGTLFLNFPMMIIFEVVLGISSSTSDTSNNIISLTLINIFLWGMIVFAIINIIFSILLLIHLLTKNIKTNNIIPILYLIVTLLFAILNIGMFVLCLPSFIAYMYIILGILYFISFIVILINSRRNKVVE